MANDGVIFIIHGRYASLQNGKGQNTLDFEIHKANEDEGQVNIKNNNMVYVFDINGIAIFHYGIGNGIAVGIEVDILINGLIEKHFVLDSFLD